MAALTKDRNTPYMEGEILEPPAAATAMIYAGAW